MRSALLAALALAGCAPAEAPLPPGTQALRRGAAFLVRAQNPDGSWGSPVHCHVHEILLGTVASHEGFSDGASALCTLALMGLPEGDPAVRAALDLGLGRLARRPPALRPTGDVDYQVWGNLYVLQCLSRALIDGRWPERRHRMTFAARARIAILAREQSALGGWGYYDFEYATRRMSGDHATSFLTAAVLVALDEARSAGLEVPEVMTRLGTRYLASLRKGDGSYCYSEGHRYYPDNMACKIKGSLGRSQAGEHALWRLGEIGEVEAASALENFFTHHHFIEIGRQRQWPHEAWYATAPYYYFFGHYYAALNVARLSPEPRARAARRLEDILCGVQEPDGSWWDFPMYGYAKAYGTGLAMLALEAVGTDPSPAKGRGRPWGGPSTARQTTGEARREESGGGECGAGPS